MGAMRLEWSSEVQDDVLITEEGDLVGYSPMNGALVGEARVVGHRDRARPFEAPSLIEGAPLARGLTKGAFLQQVRSMADATPLTGEFHPEPREWQRWNSMRIVPEIRDEAQDEEELMCLPPEDASFDEGGK